MRKIGRHADIVGAAEKLRDRPHLTLPALDRREAVALPILERRELEIGRVGVVMLPEIPLYAPQQSRNPPALRLEECHL